MTRVYYREAVGAFVVFDVARASTFDAVLKWKSDLDSKVTLANGKPVPAVLLANKADQSRDGLSPQLPKLDHFCKEHGFAGWFETSAKVGAAFLSPLYLLDYCASSANAAQSEESADTPAHSARCPIPYSASQ